MSSNIMSIVRKVVGSGAVVYNDKLKSGARSVKVSYGLSFTQAKACKSLLEAAGFSVRIQMTAYGALRLHVASARDVSCAH